MGVPAPGPAPGETRAASTTVRPLCSTASRPWCEGSCQGITQGCDGVWQHAARGAAWCPAALTNAPRRVYLPLARGWCRGHEGRAASGAHADRTLPIISHQENTSGRMPATVQLPTLPCTPLCLQLTMPATDQPMHCPESPVRSSVSPLHYRAHGMGWLDAPISVAAGRQQQTGTQPHARHKGLFRTKAGCLL